MTNPNSNLTSSVKDRLFWERDPRGSLHFAGLNLVDWVRQERIVKPTYLLCPDIVLQRAQLFSEVLQKNLPQLLSFHFAAKSNHHPVLLKKLAQAGWGVDIVSGGELAQARACGFLPEQIVFSGVAKSREEIRQALQSQVLQLNVESYPELLRIGEVAQELGVKAPVALRFNPEVHAATHPYIATGFRENKFGLDQQDLPEVVAWLQRHPDRYSYQGLSLHIGSQLLDFSALEEALAKALRMDQEIEKGGLISQSLDVGGGVGIHYQSEFFEDEKTLQMYAQVLKKYLQSYSKKIRFEPGRFWVARAGVLLAQVEYVKRTPYKKFLILNVGMNALLRPALYGAYHRIEPLQIRREGPVEIFDVVGPVCESSDILGSLRSFQNPQEGDWIAIGDTGAYGSVLASKYNLFADVEEKIV